MLIRPLFIFLAVLAAYVLTAGGHIYSPDEEILFRTTRALATDRGLAIPPLEGGGGFGTRAPAVKRADSREYGQYGIGQPLLAVPFYWAGAALARRAPAPFWQHISPSPYNEIDGQAVQRWACSWFNVLIGALLAVVLYLVCLELTGHAVASTWAAMLYALGSLAWPHSRPFFSESAAALFILLAWWALLRAERGRLAAWCALAGAAAGYAVLVKPHSLLAYPALALLLCGPIVDAARRQGRSVLAAWAAFAIPVAVCGGVLLVLNWLHFGGAMRTGYQDQPEGIAFTTPLAAGLFGFLFSAGKGLFFFSPALILGFLGWRPLARLLNLRHHALIWAIALAIAVPLGVLSKWQNWPGGWCWGPRHIFIIHPFLALPIAAFMAAAAGPAARVAAAVFLVAGAAVQLLGCSQDFIEYHHRFFRYQPVSDASPSFYYVMYDDIDRGYWNNYFQLLFRDDPAAPPRPIPLSPPRPIQDSIYIPQVSVWNGYPQMLNEGRLDSFWVRLAGEPRPAAPATPAPATPAPGSTRP